MSGTGSVAVDHLVAISYMFTDRPTRRRLTAYEAGEIQLGTAFAGSLIQPGS